MYVRIGSTSQSGQSHVDDVNHRFNAKTTSLNLFYLFLALIDTSMIKHIVCIFMNYIQYIYLHNCVYTHIRTDHKYILRQIKLHLG